ncbi:MAG: hypothetical protein VB859_18105 [Planctomycetaceae bacterium]
MPTIAGYADGNRKPATRTARDRFNDRRRKKPATADRDGLRIRGNPS